MAFNWRVLASTQLGEDAISGRPIVCGPPVFSLYGWCGQTGEKIDRRVGGRGEGGGLHTEMGRRKCQICQTHILVKRDCLTSLRCDSWYGCQEHISKKNFDFFLIMKGFSGFIFIPLANVPKVIQNTLAKVFQWSKIFCPMTGRYWQSFGYWKTLGHISQIVLTILSRWHIHQLCCQRVASTS